MAVEPGTVRGDDGLEGAGDIVLGEARPEIADGGVHRFRLSI